jgi:NAD(P)-dependent dehydrogenase (short-subunit alcohol dehydrogenase family)
MGRLSGKVALVTGAAQGLGAAFAAALAREGAKVAVTDLGDTASAVEAIRAAGGEAIGLAMDVTDTPSIAAAVAATERAFGPIGALVNNAGLFAALELKPYSAISEAEWDRVMTVNVRGMFQCVKAVVPSMVKAGGGSIVNVSSGTFFYGPPGMLHYVASKGAVIGLTRSLARELGDKQITVNAIAPGLTESEGVKGHAQLGTARQPTIAMRALKREMLPEDLVGTVVFLCSPDSAFMTGQVLNVDGGRTTY